MDSPIIQLLDDPIFGRVLHFLHNHGLYDDDMQHVLGQIMHYIDMGSGTFAVASNGVSIEFVDFPEDDETWGGIAVRVHEEGDALTFTRQR